MAGEKEKVSVKNETFSFVDTKGQDFEKIKSEVKMNKDINAPIKKGDVLGKIEYSMDGKKIGETEIVANENVKKAKYKFIFMRMAKYLLQIS